MLKKISVFALLVLACAVVAAQAQEFGTSGSSGVVVREIIHPLAPQQITQSTDPNQIIAGNGIACGDGVTTTDNQWWRLFDLDDDHGLVGQFCTENVDWGVETSTVTQTIGVNIHCLDEGLPFLKQFLTLAGSGSETVPASDLAFFNTDVAGCCDSATQDMALEVSEPDCSLSGCRMYIGANDLGQTGPSYISALGCGINDPADVATFGFPLSAWVMVVNGDGTTADDGGTGDGGTDDGGVPATTGVGLILLVLALGGGSAYFLRRK